MTPSPFELLAQGRYHELIAVLQNPLQRQRLLAQVGVVEAGLAQQGAGDALQDRKLSLLAAGDFTWGLLTARQRREFLARDVRLLSGPGREDAGKAQRAALKRLRAELGNLYSALDLALRDSDLEWLLPLSEHLADLQEITGEFETMQQRYSAILAAAERLGNSRLGLHAQLGLSVACSRLGDNPGAISAASAAEEAARRLDDEPLRAAAQHLRGSALALQGDYPAARLALEAAAQTRSRLADTQGAAGTLASLAYVEMCLDNRAQARALLLQAKQTCAAAGNLRGEAMLTQNLAVLAYEDQAPECGELYQRALSIFRELGDARGMAGCLSGLGYSFYNNEQLPAAGQALQEAAAISRKLGDRYIEATAELALGNVALLESRAADAQGHYAVSLDLSASAGNAQGEALARGGLALANLALGQPAAARELACAALSSLLAAGNQPQLPAALIQAGAVLAAQGTPEARATAWRNCLTASQSSRELGHRLDPLDRQVLAALEAELALSQVSQPPALASLEEAAGQTIALLSTPTC